MAFLLPGTVLWVGGEPMGTGTGSHGASVEKRRASSKACQIHRMKLGRAQVTQGWVFAERLGSGLHQELGSGQAAQAGMTG